MKKYKIVYNSCYGGFNLSDKAFNLYKEYGGKNDDEWTIERHELALVKVVEEMGEEANGPCADLQIEEITGNKYYIEDYDGVEQVITPNSKIFITIEE